MLFLRNSFLMLYFAFNTNIFALDPLYKQIISSENMDLKNIGFSFTALKGGSSFDHNNSSFIPASLTKMITVYYALEVLGPKYKFQTELRYTGTIQGNTLIGDLHIKGYGDPFFTTSDLINLIFMLKEKGIKKVRGHFYYDEDFLENHEFISSIGVGDQTYNQSYGSLNFEFNRFKSWIPSSEQAFARPPLKSIQLVFSEKEFLYKQNAVYEPRKKIESWKLSKKITYKKGFEIPIRRSSLYTANSFKYYAKYFGIDIPSPQKLSSKVTTKILASHLSLNLYDLAKLTMEYSNNLFAEVFLLTAASKKIKKKMSTPDAAKTMKTWLEKSFPGTGWEKSTFVNGSGLTINNKWSPKTLSHFLKLNYDKSWRGKSFWSLFSISGLNGWLKKRLAGPATSHRVFAKTGSLDYVNNIAGFLITKSNKIYSFSIFSNDMKKRELLEMKKAEGYKELKDQSKEWKQRTDRIINNMITTFIKKN